MQLLKNIDTRRSIRKYKAGEDVSDAQIKLLLEAAMKAPSACNTRPWEFLVIKSREVLDKIAEAHPHAKMLKTAPLAIIVCALPDVQSGISEGFFPQDCAAATQNILLQAQELGLSTCWCGVYPKENLVALLRDILSVKDDKIPFNIIAAGVSDEAPKQRGEYDESKVTVI